MESVPADLAVLGRAGERLFDADEVWGMNWPIFFVVAVQAAAVPVPPTPTVESLTEDAYSFDCIVSDETSRRYQIRFVQEGGRGYSTEPDNSLPGQTLFNVSVPLDQTDSMTKLGIRERLIQRSDYGNPNRLVTFYGPDLQADVTLKGISDQKFTLTIMQTRPAVPPKRNAYVGFCNATMRHQQPLTLAEAKEYLSK